MKREDLVTEALDWIGTPFHANQKSKGIGADCIGFAGGVALACGANLPSIPDAYPMRPDGSLKAYLDKYMIRVISGPQPGDILLMAFDCMEPHHVAMYIGNHMIIHAYAQARKVSMQLYTNYWKDKVKAVYRFKEVV